MKYTDYDFNNLKEGDEVVFGADTSGDVPKFAACSTRYKVHSTGYGGVFVYGGRGRALRRDEYHTWVDFSYIKEIHKKAHKESFKKNYAKKHAKKHRDISREDFPAFCVIGIPEDAIPSLAYGVAMATNGVTAVEHAEGTWEGQPENSLIVFCDNILSGMKIAFEYFGEDSMLYVNGKRGATLVWSDSRSEYLGRWETTGVTEPEDEDWTFHRGRYYVCRKYKGE